jgi:hypothetical protein
MIQAENAHRIMQLYESDYDNFLDKLKAKRKAKKSAAQQKQAEADKADKTVSEAEGYKKKHLGQKAKDLLDKAGGIEGAQSTIQNVMKYFKSDTPSDYDINVGGQGADPKAEKTIMGLPPIAVYVGGAVLVLAGIYGLSRMMKNKNTQQQIQAPVVAPVEPVLQAAA